MRVRSYAVLSRAVEEGVAFGWRRAHKHVEAPSEAATQSAIVDAVLSEISEYFDFDLESESVEERTVPVTLPIPGVSVR